MTDKPFIIDGLQYCFWSEKVFHQMNAAGIAAVHVTICYHENFPEMIKNIIRWNEYFEKFSNLIIHGRNANDVSVARDSGRTAIIFGFQNCSPIENNIGLVEICRQLGVRFMQLSYNNQSLLASGCYEESDTGITRMGKQVIREMNRVGVVIDMSHSGTQSTLDAIELSERPIAITHANPSRWHAVPRNKPDEVLKQLGESGGMLGFSLYPHHLKEGTECNIDDFCHMVAKTADLIGVDHIGFGSDLCQDQPDSAVRWMRNGTWLKSKNKNKTSEFPEQPIWFQNNFDFSNILDGLRKIGFSEQEILKIAGKNWFHFFKKSFVPSEPELSS